MMVKVAAGAKVATWGFCTRRWCFSDTVAYGVASLPHEGVACCFSRVLQWVEFLRFGSGRQGGLGNQFGFAEQYNRSATGDPDLVKKLTVKD
mmetsp:Transcript_10067/g.23545  ORF Transcript_10067/g.23545 Transcript_10067/m.23545 type:complete len:92 (+) Transcript_10067:1536-1811(+)